MFRKNRKKQRSPILFEELEPRVLFSADGLGAFAGATDISGVDPPAHILVVDSDFKVGPATERGVQDQGSDSSVQQRLELVFVDSNTPDHELLVGDLLGQEDENRRFEVIMLDASRDGIEQITDVLGQYNGVDGIHIVSHGDDGQVQLGNTTLSKDNLNSYRSDLWLWGAALGNDADILIYGCDLAATDTGQSLVNSLADVTGADVAASEDLTGNTLFGGDWDLEYTTGAIESNVAFSAAAQQNWTGVLGSIAVTTTADVLDGDADTSSLAALAIAPGSDGLVSLREAVIAANTGSGADTIVLGAGTYTLSIAGTAEDASATGDLDIRDDLTIKGAGADQTIIDGNNAHRIFHVIGSSVINVSISDLKIQNGFTSDPTDNKGAGLHINNVPAVPVVSLTNVWFSGNHTSGGGDSGGAIFNRGDLSLENVLIEGNSSSAAGGVMNFLGGTLNMTNVTLSGNSATAGAGGGLFNSQMATLLNVTVAGNSASGVGGGLHSGATTTINNTLVANNTASSNPDLDGAFVSSTGDNLIEVVGTATGLNGSDITGIDPSIGALADNGGSTMTHALLAGSQAIDKGSVAGAPSSDQRGELRDGSPDIGAFEYAAPKLAAVDEFRVNTTTTATQETSGVNRGSHRAVAVDGAGNSIVVWSDSAQDGNGWGVFAQRFDSAGNPLGSEFQVNINSSNDEYRATVAADESGRFVIAFTASDGDQTGIYLRRFNADGSAIDAADVLVNAGQTAGSQYNPSVAANNAGAMVITWQSDGASEGIYARQFNMTSAAPGDQLPTSLITVESGATADEASVDINNSGRYVVTWTQDDKLYGRRYDYATASALSAKHDLNLFQVGGSQAVVAVQEDNDFVIAYRSDLPALKGVWMRQFRDNGSAYPIVTRVGPGANAVSPSIDMATNGDFIVVYENDDAAGTGVFARRFNAAGDKRGDEFQVNTSTTLNQHQASIAVVDLDNFVVAWSGSGDQPGQEDASGGVFARQYGTATVSVNAAPTATNLTGTSPYNEGDASVAITDIVVSDVDASETITATLTLANTATGSLTANDGATYTAATGVWTITDTVANVNTALANLVFAPVSNNDQDTTIAVAIDDGDEDASGPLTGTITLDVTPAVGGAVSTLVPGAQNTSEDTTLVFSTGGGNAIIVGDGTAGDPVLRTQLSVTNGILTLNTTAGLAFENGADGTSSMTITGLESAVNTALDGLTFTPTSNYDGPANLQIITDLQAGLQGYYTFTQPGALGQDSSPGGANAGVPSGPGAAPDPHAVFNSDRGSDALVLDGVDDNIQIAGRFGTPSNLTLAAWVNVAAVNSQEVISIGNSIALRVNDVGSGNGVTGFFNDGARWQHTNSNQFIGGDGWHHVAFTFDNASNTQIIYIDGIAQATTGHPGSINWALDPGTTIGSHTDQRNFWLNGMLDDARIYDRALGTSEIQALANNRASDTSVVSITVDPANDPPTLTLNNTVLLLAENTDTTTRIHVADIAVADDGVGSNMLSLAGSDAALFEIDSGVLYLKAGVLLDFEAQNRLDVRVLVDDSSVGGSPDDSTDFALAVDDVNEAPVVSFSGNGVDENTDTTGGYVVGRLSASDPDLGDLATFTVIGGADQDRFSIRGGNELVFNDGLLDFEKKATYEVTVRVTDAGNLQQTQTITITVNDLNEPILFPNGGETTTSLVPAVKNTVPIVIDANTFSVATVNTTIVGPGTSSLTPDPVPGRTVSTQAVAEEGTTTDELATVEEDIFSDGASDSRFIDATLNRPINNLNAGVEQHGKNINLNAGVQQPGKNINLKQLVKAIANLNPATKLLAETATSLEGAFDVTSLDSYSILDNGSFRNDLDDFRNELQAEARRGQTVVGSAVAASTGISVGYVIWLVRGGVVLSSVVSSLPAWRLIDPLPVLATVLGNSQDEEDDESLASMLEPEDPENDEDGPNEE